MVVIATHEVAARCHGGPIDLQARDPTMTMSLCLLSRYSWAIPTGLWGKGC